MVRAVIGRFTGPESSLVRLRFHLRDLEAVVDHHELSVGVGEVVLRAIGLRWVETSHVSPRWDILVDEHL